MIPHTQPPVTLPPRMSGVGIKVNLVNLIGPLTPLTIRTWLDKCKNLFECAEYQYGKVLDDKIKVSLAGTKMVDPAAAACVF